MRFVFSFFVILFCVSAIAAQENHPVKPDAERAALLSGMGHHHHPISTKSPEAQRFFDQGITLDYAFNHEEAARSFRRAAELDPKAAMPYWGLALVLGPNYNLDVDMEREKEAFDAIQKAKTLAAAGPENERAYIDALAARYSNDPKPDFKKLAQNYAKAMGEVSKHYPDDLDAATIYAEALMDLRPWQLWTFEGAPAPGTEEIITVLESVLKRDPDHVGANHYYVHAVEASPHPERALPSAERLQTLVPGAGHLVHMPAHIYYRTGDYAAAATSNEAAVAADQAYLAATHEQGMYPMMYLSHNYHFLAYAYAQQGRFEDAKKAADELAAHVAPHAGEMPTWMAQAFLTVPTFILLRFDRWSDILARPQPAAGMQYETSMWHFARGIAYAATGDRKNAEAERKAFTEVAATMPADTPMGNSRAKTILELAEAMLDARIAEAAGDRKAAIAPWRKAAQFQDGVAYDEPPDWYYPVRESLGGALFRDGQFGEAEKMFRADLDRNPRNGRSLFGLWQSLLAQKKGADADWIRREFMTAWKAADTQLRIEDL